MTRLLFLKFSSLEILRLDWLFDLNILQYSTLLNGAKHFLIELHVKIYYLIISKRLRNNEDIWTDEIFFMKKKLHVPWLFIVKAVTSVIFVFQFIITLFSPFQLHFSLVKFIMSSFWLLFILRLYFCLCFTESKFSSVFENIFW